MASIGFSELFLILLISLLVLKPSDLMKICESLGKKISLFRQSMANIQQEFSQNTYEDPDQQIKKPLLIPPEQSND